MKKDFNGGGFPWAMVKPSFFDAIPRRKGQAMKRILIFMLLALFAGPPNLALLEYAQFFRFKHF